MPIGRVARAFAAVAMWMTTAVVAAAGCKSSQTVRGYVGEVGDAGCPQEPHCAIAQTPPRKGGSSGCGKAAPAQAIGAYKKYALGVSCEAENASNRLYYVRLPPGYDPNKPYRTVYLGPGCGPPQDSQPSILKVYPMDTASDPDAILVAMEQGFYNKAEYNRTDCSDSPDAGLDMLCHYCFDDGAGTTCPSSVEYGYFDHLHKQIEDDFCVDTERQFYAGYSSGGWMAHQLGCQFPDVLRAQASVTGGLPLAIRNGSKTCVDHPIAAFLIHDAMDPSNPYSGSISALERLLRLNKCVGGTTMATAPTEPYMISSRPNSANFSCVKYTGCPAEYPIVFCTSNGLAHGSQEGAAVPGFWEFFERF